MEASVVGSPGHRVAPPAATEVRIATSETTGRGIAAAWRGRRGRVVRQVLSIVLVVLIVVGVLPQLADLGEAVRLIPRIGPGWLVAMALLAVGVLVAIWIALARLIGVTVGQAGTAHLLSTAVANTVPAGGAVAIGVNLRVYATFGRGPAPTTRGLLSIGVIDNGVKVLLPVLVAALAPLLPGEGRLPPVAVAIAAGVAAGGVAFAVVMLRSEGVVRRVAARSESVVRRWRGKGEPGSWARAAVGYQRELRSLLASRGPVAATAVAATHLLQAMLLVVALRGVGVGPAEVGVQEVVIAYALMRLITALPITPGGLGIAEVGLIGGLSVTAGTGSETEIAAAVLLFRALTYLLPIVLAAPAWGAWRIQRRGPTTSLSEDPVRPPDPEAA